ncbi:MAG TPA: hypothetical protein VFB54_19850 [Burkholderiales bacterium]|nr:hypothetical protein [Burkholderiales bacterium]
MTTSLGMLIVGFDYSGVASDEFHDWYDNEHIPERKAVPGFLTAQRWLGAGIQTLSVAIYDLENLQVLQGEAYRCIAGDNFSPWSKRVIGKCRTVCRFEAEQVYPGNQLSSSVADFAVLIATTSTEHMHSPKSMAGALDLPGLVGTRGFKTRDGSEVNLYEFCSTGIGSEKLVGILANARLPWIELTPSSPPVWSMLLRRYSRANAQR